MRVRKGTCKVGAGVEGRPVKERGKETECEYETCYYGFELREKRKETGAQTGAGEG